jgi:hypothetical protein
MLRNIWNGASAALLLAFSVSTPVMAFGIAASTSASAPDPLGDNSISDRDNATAFSGSVFASSEAGGFGALAVAEASAEFGINRAFAQATSPGLGLRFPPIASAFASSRWVDELTINTAAPGGFISVGFQFHVFPIQSSYTYPSPILTYEMQYLDLRAGNQITLFRLTMYGDGNIISYLPIYPANEFDNDGFELIGDNDGDVLRIVGLTIPFTANRAFGFASSLGCETRAPYSDANVQTCNANGTSLWGGVKGVTDVNGNALTDWTVRSASGTDYTKSLIPPAVPEPASWAMLAIGMFAIGGTMRWRWSRRGFSATPAPA